ncbi:carbohydrate ABC transporter permease [Streptomyces pathocidini]|uniref:carbohydrate ABC transporter permease n=1 Tax=Streptomyces pathocidini TaxID=1650571 RepID=UPI0034008F96
MTRRPNWVAGGLSCVWLAVVLLPLWLMVSWSVQLRQDYLDQGPFDFPRAFTTKNLGDVLSSGFGDYLVNTAIVTVFSVVLTLALALPAAYAIVRSRAWLATASFRVFLLGLAIPAQATIIPVYWLITRLELYDTLTAIVLPTVAFGLPLAVLVLAGSLRDVSRDLYEAMTLDGAGPFLVFVKLVLPLCRASVTTVGIYTGLNAWNGFLFPLILTQSDELRVMTLGLWNFQSEFGVNTPALMTGVLLSALPVLVLYILARRWLVAGLAGVGGK